MNLLPYLFFIFLISYNSEYVTSTGTRALYYNPLLSKLFNNGYVSVSRPAFAYSQGCNEGSYQGSSDCSKYKQCVNGEFVQFECANGLHWNTALDTCDWPANAKCSGGAAVQDVSNVVDNGQNTSDDDDVSVLLPAVPAVTTQKPAPIITPAPAPVTVAPSSQDTGKKVVCYFTNWAWYRPEPGKYDPGDIDTELCTHVNFGFVVLHPTKLVIKVHDPWSDVDNRFFTRVSGLKKKGIKTLVALGGWNDSEGNKYSRMVATKESRRKFILSALVFIEKYGFQGLDLDWEYPVCWQVNCKAGPAADKENFAALCKELSDEFRPRGLLLTAAVSPAKKVIDAGYDVPALNKYLDIINVMTYDYYGHWDKKTGHVAPLYQHPLASNPTFSANFTMNYWHELGADKNKLVMGMPMYGQTFTIGSSDEHGIGAPAPRGGGKKGRFTRQKGFASYYEICNYVKQDGYELVYDEEKRMGPYAHKGNQWVGFDDVDTIRQKSQYIKDNGFGGGMIWALDLDDFNNMCGCERYPLLKTINRVLRNYNSPDPHCTLDSNAIGSKLHDCHGAHDCHNYETRQQDINVLYGLQYPASTVPLSPHNPHNLPIIQRPITHGDAHNPYNLPIIQHVQRGSNIVPYLLPAESQNTNNLKKYKPSVWPPTLANDQPQKRYITSYPIVNHVSPWAKFLYHY